MRMMQYLSLIAILTTTRDQTHLPCASPKSAPCNAAIPTLRSQNKCSYLSEVLSTVHLVLTQNMHVVEMIDLQLVVGEVDAGGGQHLLLNLNYQYFCYAMLILLFKVIFLFIPIFLNELSNCSSMKGNPNPYDFF